MGIPFPTGLTHLETRYPQAVRWAWALNAAASVLGSATAIFLAIYIGLRATVLVGAGLYLCALLVVWMQRQATPIVTAGSSGSRILDYVEANKTVVAALVISEVPLFLTQVCWNSRKSWAV